MPRLDYPLWLAIVAVAAVAAGQGPAPVVVSGPPDVATELGRESLPPELGYMNSYPVERCEDWNCCKQWWCETWYTRAELLTLARNHNAQDRVLIQTGAGAPVFSSDAISFGLAPGISTLIGTRLDGQNALEFAYFGANQWNQERASFRAADLSLPGQLGLLDDFNHANAILFTLRSQFHNAEINYLHDIHGISLLAGFRFLNWQEQLLFQSTDSDLTHSDYRVQLSNNLSGGQIGARVARYHYGLDLEFTGKAGIFGNQATQAQNVTDLNGTSVIRHVATTNGTVAFIGDLNFSAVCPLTRTWRLRSGYNLLYVSGLALAVNQLDFSNNTFSGRRLRQDSDVFLHGFNVGLEAIW